MDFGSISRYGYPAASGFNDNLLCCPDLCLPIPPPNSRLGISCFHSFVKHIRPCTGVVWTDGCPLEMDATENEDGMEPWTDKEDAVGIMQRQWSATSRGESTSPVEGLRSKPGSAARIRSSSAKPMVYPNLSRPVTPSLNSAEQVHFLVPLYSISAAAFLCEAHPVSSPKGIRRRRRRRRRPFILPIFFCIEWALPVQRPFLVWA
jgi:hypothetical protein